MKALIEHLKCEMTLETTSSLREFTENNINVSLFVCPQIGNVDFLPHQITKSAIDTNRNNMHSKFEQVQEKDRTQDAYVKSFEDNFQKFCRAYTTDMENENLLDLVPGLTKDDIKPDSEGV